MTDWPALRPQLVQMAAEGMTAKEIGARLGTTKNAVIGAARRLGVALLAKPSAPGGGRPKAVATAPAPVPPAPMFGPWPRPVPMLRLVASAAPPRRDPRAAIVARPQVVRHRTCQWPDGDPREPSFRFCDRPIGAPPYCTEHQALAWVRGTRHMPAGDAA